MSIPDRVGRYELLELLGRGGMADVYLARVTGLADFERRFVVKMIRADADDPERFGKFFIDEARITVHLQHPNITQVFDLGLHGAQPYLGMEYIDGPDLKQLIQWSAQIRGAVPFNLAVFIAREVLQGLAYAHEATRPDGTPMDIVHRDISPSNILLGRNGVAKLCDFGVAQATIASQAQGAGFVVGKAAYLAPELARGEAATARSDLFSMGSVLFFLFTGEPLINASTYEGTLLRLAQFDVDQRLDQVMNLPTALEPILRRAMHQDAGARFASAREMLDHIEDFVYEEGVRATRADLAQYLVGLDEQLVRDEASVDGLLSSGDDVDEAAQSAESWQIQESESWSGLIVSPGDRDPDETSGGSGSSGPSLISSREFSETYGADEATEARSALDATVARPADWKPEVPEEFRQTASPGWNASEMLVLPDADTVTLYDPARGPRVMGGEEFDDLIDREPPEFEILVRFDDSELRPYAEWLTEGNPLADVTRSSFPEDTTPLSLGTTLARLVGAAEGNHAIQLFHGDKLVVLVLDRGWICAVWNESIGAELMDHLVVRGAITGAQLDVLRGLAKGRRRSLPFLAVQRRLIPSGRLWKEARHVIAEHVRRVVQEPAWRVNVVPCPPVGWGRDRAGVPLHTALMRAGEQHFSLPWFLGLDAGLADAPLTVDTARLESQADLRLSRAQIQLAWTIHRGIRVREVLADRTGAVDADRARDLYLLILGGVVQPYLASGTSSPGGG